MSTDLFRNYIDLINEASEQQRLDEGIGNWLQSKVSGLLDKFLASSPKAQQAYKQAQGRKNELINILKTSKSAEEAKKKTEALAKADAGSGISEGFGNNMGQTIIGGLGVLGGSAYLVLNKIYDTMAHIMATPVNDPSMINSMLADERLPALLINYGLPVMLIIYGLTLLYYVGMSDDRD
jgi:hypothetical protein